MADRPEFNHDIIDVVVDLVEKLLNDPDTTTTQALAVACAFLSISTDILARVFGVDTAKTMLHSAADAFDHIPDTFGHIPTEH